MIAPAAPTPPSRLRGWLPLILGGATYAVILCVIVVLRAETTTDFRDFWETARHFRETGQISSELGVHNYLPFFTAFMMPWGLVPLRVAIVLFTLLSLGLCTLTIALAEVLLNGGLGPRPRKVTLVTIGLMLPYVHSCGVLGQMSLLLLFLVVATWFLVERGKEWAAGVALGLAALIKLLPAALIVFFLLKRRWRVAASAVGVMAVLGFGLPLAAVGFEETVIQHRAFHERAIKDQSAKNTIVTEKPRKAKYSNNSLPIVLRRLLSRVNGDPSESDPDRTLFVNFVDLRPKTIWPLYLVLMGLLVVASVPAALPVSKPWPPADPQAGSAVRAQFGAWCCLMLLAAPLLWTHYLPLAYWPLALVADRADGKERAESRPCFACLLALLVWLIGALLLVWPAARAAGAQLWSIVILWVAVFTLAIAHPRRLEG